MKKMNVKRMVSLFLALLMTALMAAGCGTSGKESSGSAEPGQSSESFEDSLKTFADAFAVEGENSQFATYENLTVYVFMKDDIYYRVTGAITKDMSDSIFNLEVDDNYEKNYREIVSPVSITRVENLNEQILTKEQLDALIGKSGADLIADGWRTGFYNLDTLEFSLEYGAFAYRAFFEGTISVSIDDFDPDTDLNDVTLKSIEYESIGDATNVEIEEIDSEE